MSSFVRFIVLLLIGGVMLNLAMVLHSNEQARRKQVKDIADERMLLGKVIKMTSGKSRRGEITVEWQKIGGDKKVIQTSLLVRQFMLTESGEQQPLPVMRVLIAGSTICIDALRVQFGKEYPEELLRGADLVYFHHIFAAGAPEKEEKDWFTFLPHNQPPQATQIHNLGKDPHVSYMETRLWYTVWDSILTPALAKKNGVTVITPKSAPVLSTCQEVRLGGFYEISVGLEGVTFSENDPRGIAREHRGAMLQEAKTLPE